MFRPSFIRRFRMLSRALSVASDVLLRCRRKCVARGELVRRKRYYPLWQKVGSRVRLRRESCISNRNHRLTWSSLAAALPDAARRSRRRAPALRCLASVRRASFPARVSIQERGIGACRTSRRGRYRRYGRDNCTSAAALPMRRSSTRSCGGIPEAIAALEAMGVSLKRPANPDEPQYIPCFDHSLRMWRGLERDSMERGFGRALCEGGVVRFDGCELLDIAMDDGCVRDALFFDRSGKRFRAVSWGNRARGRRRGRALQAQPFCFGQFRDGSGDCCALRRAFGEFGIHANHAGARGAAAQHRVQRKRRFASRVPGTRRRANRVRCS